MVETFYHWSQMKLKVEKKRLEMVEMEYGKGVENGLVMCFRMRNLEKLSLSKLGKALSGAMPIVKKKKKNLNQSFLFID